MARPFNLARFVRQAREVHGTLYDYRNTAPVPDTPYVRIGCPVHGEFFQRAGHHLAGQKCPQCAARLRSAVMKFRKKHDAYPSVQQIDDLLHTIAHGVPNDWLTPEEMGHDIYAQ